MLNNYARIDMEGIEKALSSKTKLENINISEGTEYAINRLEGFHYLVSSSVKNCIKEFSAGEQDFIKETINEAYELACDITKEKHETSFLSEKLRYSVQLRNALVAANS